MMDASNIKLLAFDMDGTALNDAGKVTDRTRAALQAAADKGIMLVPATGRGFALLRDETLGIHDIEYAISANGAILYEYATSTELMRAMIPWALAADLVDDLNCREVKFYLQLGDDNSSYFGSLYDFELFAPLEGKRVWRDNLEPDLAGKLREMKVDVAKIGVVYRWWERDLAAGMAFIAERYPSLRAFRAERESIEICDRGVSKGRALEQLCLRLGIDPADVCAVGDNGNDVSMIANVGLGVAMANGMDEAKAVARVVTERTNDEDGLADFIERVLL